MAEIVDICCCVLVVFECQVVEMVAPISNAFINTRTVEHT